MASSRCCLTVTQYNRLCSMLNLREVRHSRKVTKLSYRAYAAIGVEGK